MVCDHIDNNLNPVFVRFIAQLLEFLLCAKLVIADFIVGRLVMVVPFAIAHQLHPAVVADKAFVDWGGLYCGKARFRYIFQVFPDSLERPAPCVQYCAVLNLFC